jgi:hypothetical protein
MAKIVIKHPSYTHIPAPPMPPAPISTPPFMDYAAQQIIAGAKSKRFFGRPQKIQPVQPKVNIPAGQRADFAHPKVNNIAIMDVDWKPKQKDGTDTPNTRYIILPTVPQTLDFNPDPNWAVIASVGRNTPFFHYMGSEDTLAFTIDWYARNNQREDVIFNCRWLEAKTKADAYREDPHRVMLKWGTEDELFQDSLWIVFKASYKLSNFHKGVSMIPQQAYQEIILKRVVDFNLSSAQVYGAFSRNMKDINMSL